MKKLFILLFIQLYIIPACKKDSDDPKPTNTERKKLLSGTWKLSTMTSSPATDWNGDDIAETEYTYGELPCEKDDLITYMADGTWQADMNGTACDYQELDNDIKGHWAISDDGNTFTDDEAEIANNDGDGQYQYVILQLDEHIFKYQLKRVGESYTFSLTRQ